MGVKIEVEGKIVAEGEEGKRLRVRMLISGEEFSGEDVLRTMAMAVIDYCLNKGEAIPARIRLGEFPPPPPGVEIDALKKVLFLSGITRFQNLFQSMVLSVTSGAEVAGCKFLKEQAPVSGEVH